MTVADARLAGIVEDALGSGRETLLEPEGFELLNALGVASPAHRFVRDADEVAALDLAPLGRRIVVKVVSRELPHRSDVGALATVPAEPDRVAAAVRALADRFRDLPVAGFTLQRYVAHTRSLGGELLLGLRQTDDFGPVVAVGPGGVHAESFVRALRPDAGVALFVDPEAPLDAIAATLARRPVTRIAGGLGRDGRRLVSLAVLAGLVRRLLRFGASPSGRRIAELEVNPLALTAAGPVALDVLARLGHVAPSGVPPRPLAKLRHLLEPRTIAVVGVSGAANPGRLVLRNLLREGFPADRLYVVKPGMERIDGVRCVPTLAALPEAVDLCVVAVQAAAVPALLAQAIAGRRTESLIVIPGGLGERDGSEALERDIRLQLATVRQTPWGGPILNGGNCLGVRSAPGGYDTTFIPVHKLPRAGSPPAPVAILAQSGALAVARWSRMTGADPRYVVSVGNQTDLTVGDYLAYLKDDPAVRLFACYVEGFRPLDGRRWLDAAAAIVADGRTVLLYRGARTPAGARAGASHTAAVAGDYVVTRELAREVGVVVADTLEEFDDLVRLGAALAERPAAGTRLGVVSNAGFECVTAGDAPPPLTLAALGPGTIARLEGVLATARLEDVVLVRNPVDLTPTMGDAGFEDAVRALLDDDGVDLAVVGCVPLTAALQTLPRADDHPEDLRGHDAIGPRLGRVWRDGGKPWVAVVDAGHRYDALAAQLEREGIPTFPTMDRALRALAGWSAASRRATPGTHTTFQSAGMDAW